MIHQYPYLRVQDASERHAAQSTRTALVERARHVCIILEAQSSTRAQKAGRAASGVSWSSMSS